MRRLLPEPRSPLLYPLATLLLTVLFIPIVSLQHLGPFASDSPDPIDPEAFSCTNVIVPPTRKPSALNTTSLYSLPFNPTHF